MPKYQAQQRINFASARGQPRSNEHLSLWRSAWLHKRTLIALQLLFISLLVSLLVLWHYDLTHQGIRITLSSNHYAWTYGPTAILVIVVSLWRQVDYHCKSIQPWLEMRKGQSIASESLLLDYVSPMQISSFVSAVRRRHYPVAASVLGFATLKLVILFSTFLLESSPTPISDNVPLNIRTTFDGSNFWMSIQNGNSTIANVTQAGQTWPI